MPTSRGRRRSQPARRRRLTAPSPPLGDRRRSTAVRTPGIITGTAHADVDRRRAAATRRRPSTSRPHARRERVQRGRPHVVRGVAQRHGPRGRGAPRSRPDVASGPSGRAARAPRRPARSAGQQRDAARPRPSRRRPRADFCAPAAPTAAAAARRRPPAARRTPRPRRAHAGRSRGRARAATPPPGGSVDQLGCARVHRGLELAPACPGSTVVSTGAGDSRCDGLGLDLVGARRLVDQDVHARLGLRTRSVSHQPSVRRRRAHADEVRGDHRDHLVGDLDDRRLDRASRGRRRRQHQVVLLAQQADDLPDRGRRDQLDVADVVGRQQQVDARTRAGRRRRRPCRTERSWATLARSATDVRCARLDQAGDVALLQVEVDDAAPCGPAARVARPRRGGSTSVVVPTPPLVPGDRDDRRPAARAAAVGGRADQQAAACAADHSSAVLTRAATSANDSG